MKLKPYRYMPKNAPMVPLKKLLPLNVPFSIMIEPTNICNFRCKFCPTGNHDLLKQVGRPKGFMSKELYVKIIDDIHLMCKRNKSILKRLHLYKDGEPLLNKNLGYMIAYAKEQTISESIETTTNGAFLVKEKSLEIIECGLDVIRISIEHTTDNGYKEITKTFNDYNKIRSNVSFLFKEKEKKNSNLKIHVKIVDSGLSKKEKESFLADFSSISDSLNIDQLMGWSKSDIIDWKLGRTISTGMDATTHINSRIVCPEPFSKLAINFNGTVSICCVDWSYGTVVGDLNTESLVEIWYGEKLKNFRLLHLNGERSKIEACRNCDYLKGFAEHTNLDNDTRRLSQIYSDLLPHN